MYAEERQVKRMERTVLKVDLPIPAQPKAKRVSAYARVSSGKDTMLQSLSAQISYYNQFIQNHNGWQFAGVYADEAKTGTKDSRENFRRMIDDCRAGEIDMIVTKSISRFARNTVTLLETVRELKTLGIDVYFEEQNIHSMSSDGELMLTILASYAQEESLSASENQKWRIQKQFEQGILPMFCKRIYGYQRTKDFGFEIVPGEAVTVKEIFERCVAGWGVQKIRNELNARGILTECGQRWSEKKVRYLLSNERYIGNLLLQKYYVTDHLSKKHKKNRGERPQYFVENNHAPIISKELFDAAQVELQRRAEKHYKGMPRSKYPFTGMLQCENCKSNYKRKVTAARVVWICGTFNKEGKAACASKQIPEETLIQETAAVLGIDEFDAIVFRERIRRIVVANGNRLIFHFADKTQQVRVWKDRSRSESWNTEMRENARQNALKRRRG